MADNDTRGDSRLPSEVSSIATQKTLIRREIATPTTVKQLSVARPPAAAPPAVDATFLWGIARKGWYWIVPLGLMLFLLAGAAILVLHEPSYEARFRLEIDDDNFVVFENRDRNQTRDFIDLQRALMLSNNTLERVLSDPKIGSLPRVENSKDPVKFLREEIKVTGAAGNRLIDVVFVDEDPQAAALVVNTVVDEFLRFRRSVDQTRTFESERDVRAALAKAETEFEAAKNRVRDLSLVAVQTENAVVIERESGSIDDSHLNNLRSERSRLASEIRVREVALAEKLSAAKAKQEEAEANVTSVAEVVITEDMIDADPLVARLMSQLRQTDARIESIRSSSTIGDNNPSMRRILLERDVLAGELEALRKQRRFALETMAQKPTSEAARTELGDLAQADMELSELKLRLEVVGNQIKEYLSGLSQSTASSVEVQFAEADLEEWQSIRSLVNNRLIQLQTEREAGDLIRELERATPPQVPVEELPLKLLALALAGGMGLPVGIALLLELSSRRVDDASQLEARSKLPVLAEIAAIPVKKQGATKGEYRELKLFGESVDALSTSLILAQDLKDCQVFAITSALAGEGKTSVCCQLAVSIARATGKRILIVDGDLRSPDVHHVFGRPMTRGLTAALAGEIKWREGLDTEWSEQVHLLTAGRLKGSPHRLFSSGVFDGLLAEMRREYDYILIDTPPVLPASESLIICQAADACLMAALRDRSRIDQLIQAYHRLQAAGANVAGSVLSGVPVREYAKYYGEYYQQVPS